MHYLIAFVIDYSKTEETKLNALTIIEYQKKQMAMEAKKCYS